MFYLISLFWILSITGLLVLLTKKRFGYVCTMTFLLGSFLFYVFAYINKITYAYYLSWAIIGCFWIYLIKLVVKKDKEKIKEFLQNFFTSGFYVFVILCVYSFILNRYNGFTYCDEFTHWGPMVIATIKSNGFYAQTGSLLTFHKDYPPLFSLMETLWCAFGSFKYSETYLYIALNTFMFSCFMPMVETIEIKKENLIKLLTVVLSIVLVGITIDKTFTAQEYAFVYNSIYTDWPLAVFSAYSIYMIYIEKDWKCFIFVVLTINLVSFVLMKQIGLCFYLIVLLYAIVKALFIDKKLNKKKLVIGIICFGLFPILAYFSWQYIINLYELKGQFVISDLQFSEVFNIAKGNTEFLWKQEAYANFIYSIVNRPLKLHPFEMSYFIYVLFISVLLLIINKFNKEGITLSIAYIVGSIGYALTMLLLYMLAYDIYEAPRLASFDRYMNTYLYFGTVLLLLVAFNSIQKRNSKKNLYSIFCVCMLCLLIEPASLENIIPKLKVVDEEKNVLVIQQFGDFKPAREELNGLRFKFNKIGYVDKDEYSFDEWNNFIKQNDLLYVVGYDDTIYKDYWLNMNQEVYLWNDSLYEIIKDNGNIKINYQTEQYYDYVMKYYLMEK